jgi:hypothetical protein
MKVLAGPRVDLRPGGTAARLCRLLAGEHGEVVSLATAGLRNPYRRFSAAEISALRGVLRGDAEVVGYVCTGVTIAPGGAGAPAAAGAAAPEMARLIVVTDHVNLTWRSPLEGPNDDRVGSRFPSMDGVYVPETAASRCGAAGDMMVSRGVVAGIADDRAPSEREIRTAGGSGWVAASSELVAPVMIAAHMGLRVAAVVMV